MGSTKSKKSNKDTKQIISYSTQSNKDSAGKIFIIIKFKKETIAFFKESNAWAVSVFISKLVSLLSNLMRSPVTIDYEQMQELNTEKLQNLIEAQNNDSHHEYLVKKWLTDGVRLNDTDLDNSFLALQCFAEKLASKHVDKKESEIFDIFYSEEDQGFIARNLLFPYISGFGKWPELAKNECITAMIMALEAMRDNK